ncbi:MAG: hypothetical protein Q4E54_05640 [Lachnospiraceae bacterium]|nr:hypothetical protein [Lachnospiraceae bacterium]
MEEKKMLEMSEEEFKATLEDIEKSNREQAYYAKKTWIMTVISTVSILVVMVFLLIYCAFLIPKVNNMLNQAQVSLDNIADVSAEIRELDFEGLMNGVGGLVTTTEEDLNKAMKKIEGIDIDGLNKSIKNLGDVIEPMADFFDTLENKKTMFFGTDTKDQNESQKGNDSGFSLFNLLQ